MLRLQSDISPSRPPQENNRQPCHSDAGSSCKNRSAATSSPSGLPFARNYLRLALCPITYRSDLSRKERDTRARPKLPGVVPVLCEAEGGHPCLTTVVIPPCHNTHDDHFTTFTNALPRGIGLLANLHSPVAVGRGNGRERKCQPNSKIAEFQFRTMFVFLPRPAKRTVSTNRCSGCGSGYFSRVSRMI